MVLKWPPWVPQRRTVYLWPWWLHPTPDPAVCMACYPSLNSTWWGAAMSPMPLPQRWEWGNISGTGLGQRGPGRAVVLVILGAWEAGWVDAEEEEEEDDGDDEDDDDDHHDHDDDDGGSAGGGGGVMIIVVILWKQKRRWWWWWLWWLL